MFEGTGLEEEILLQEWVRLNKASLCTSPTNAGSHEHNTVPQVMALLTCIKFGM